MTSTAARVAVGVIVALVSPACRTAQQPAAPLPPPAERIEVELSEYRFNLVAPTAPGRFVFRSSNVGRLGHQLVLVALPKDFPGTIEEELRSEGSRPVPPIAYLPTRQPGETGTFAVDLTPGRYGLLCFLADPDGQTHARKGMTLEFRIAEPTS